MYQSLVKQLQMPSCGLVGSAEAPRKRTFFKLIFTFVSSLSVTRDSCLAAIYPIHVVRPNTTVAWRDYRESVVELTASKVQDYNGYSVELAFEGLRSLKRHYSAISPWVFVQLTEEYICILKNDPIASSDVHAQAKVWRVSSVYVLLVVYK